MFIPVSNHRHFFPSCAAVFTDLSCFRYFFLFSLVSPLTLLALLILHSLLSKVSLLICVHRGVVLFVRYPLRLTKWVMMIICFGQRWIWHTVDIFLLLSLLHLLSLLSLLAIMLYLLEVFWLLFPIIALLVLCCTPKRMFSYKWHLYSSIYHFCLLFHSLFLFWSPKFCAWSLIFITFPDHCYYLPSCVIVVLHFCGFTTVPIFLLSLLSLVTLLLQVQEHTFYLISFHPFLIFFSLVLCCCGYWISWSLSLALLRHRLPWLFLFSLLFLLSVSALLLQVQECIV